MCICICTCICICMYIYIYIDIYIYTYMDRKIDRSIDRQTDIIAFFFSSSRHRAKNERPWAGRSSWNVRPGRSSFHPQFAPGGTVGRPLHCAISGHNCTNGTFSVQKYQLYALTIPFMECMPPQKQPVITSYNQYSLVN